MKVKICLAVLVVFGSFAVMTGIGEARDGSFVAHIREGSLKVDARITPLDDGHTFQIEVTRVAGINSGSIGLSTGSDGSCYCAILGAAHFSVDGQTREVLTFVQTWGSAQLPCGLVVTDDNETIIGSGAFQPARCR